MKVKVEEPPKVVAAETEEELTARGQKRGNITILLFYGYVKPVWTN